MRPMTHTHTYQHSLMKGKLVVDDPCLERLVWNKIKNCLIDVFQFIFQNFKSCQAKHIKEEMGIFK